MEIGTQFVTAGLSVLGGVMVYVLGQVFVRLLIDPIDDLRKLVYQIATDFTFFQNRFGYGQEMDREERMNLVNTFRRHASDLRAYVWTITWYPLWQKLGILKNRENMLTASRELIGYSNSVTARDGIDWNNLMTRQQHILQLFGFGDPD